MGFKRRGIFIITSLFIVLLVMMILAAVVKLVPSTLSSAESFNDDQKALTAAQAGVRYAVARLQQDFLWKAAADPPLRIVDLPDFVVEEDNGNVFGYLKTGDGEVSQFRIRFNFQDGNPGQDDLADPVRLVSHPYVSVNNLTNYVTPADVPLTGPGPTFAVPDGYDWNYQVPTREVILVVEGLAGDGLRDTTPESLEPPPGTSRRVSRVYVEAGFSQGNELGGDSVLSGGGSIEVNLAIPVDEDGKTKGKGGHLLLTTVSGQGQVNVRAKESLSIQGGGEFNVKAGRIVKNEDGRKLKGGVDGLLSFGKLSSFREDPDTVTTESVPSPPLMAIEWNSLNFPDTDLNSTSSAQLKAGVYFWDTATQQMQYYDEPYTGPDWTPSTPFIEVDSDFASVRSDSAGGINWQIGGEKARGPRSGPLISVNGDVNVQPTANTDGIFFISSDSDNVTYEFQFKGPKNNTRTFYSQGDFYVQGPIQGRGTSVVAGGELTVTNGGVNIAVAPDAESGVNLYSKGDMLISTNINSKDGSKAGRGASEYADLKLTGLAYTWGNFTAILDDPTTASKAGNFQLTGSLTAYGGNPATDQPGATGGDISISALRPSLRYDPAYSSAITGATSGELTKVLWTTY